MHTGRPTRLLLLVIGLFALFPSLAEARTVHVYVALCDNENQGIVPVPARLGNGMDPAGNLYWGAAYGIKTFFRRSKQWTLLSSGPGNRDPILERVVFKHKASDTYLVADAYRGDAIRQAVVDFLNAAAGHNEESIAVATGAGSASIQAGGGAALLAFIGHNGLMDFTLREYPQAKDVLKRQAVILACASKPYFTAPLRAAGAEPLLWTTGLMAPEAYTLHAALEGWVAGEPDTAIRQRAAEAYHQYQKCGVRAALRLFVSGW